MNNTTREVLDTIARSKAAASATPKIDRRKKNLASDDHDSYAPVGLAGVMAATEKLLAINRGMAQPDERDSLAFKRVVPVDKLLGERIRMDASKTQRMVLRNAARRKSFSGLMPFMFNPEAESLLLGNPLSSPLEEINPLHLVEQHRRITQMGPGGIGSDQAITSEMQNIHPSQFGFLSPLEGPECHSPETLVMTERGELSWEFVFTNFVDVGEPIRLLSWHLNKKSNAIELEFPSSFTRDRFDGELIRIKTPVTELLVTPNHDIIYFSESHGKWVKSTAEQMYGMPVLLPGAAPLRELDDFRVESWSRELYAGDVFCATLPAGSLLTRSPESKACVWSGNSERIGVDARVSWGVKLGSDGQLYQRFLNRRTGKHEWVSAAMLQGKVVKLPD